MNSHQPKKAKPESTELDDLVNQDSKSASVITATSSPLELVEWGLPHFLDQKVVMTSSYGMEGCVLMDMCSNVIEQLQLPPLTIACIDTDFFFPETKQLAKKLAEKYANLNFVTWKTELTPEQQAEKYGKSLWKNNPNACCHLRKVIPMRDNIGEYDIWITALRRSQTAHRGETPVMAWDWQYQMLKFCPLATWTRKEVWEYVQKNEVPFNQLHLQNYPSVGCYHCTKPVPGSQPDSDARSGRWEGEDKEECGLHFSI